MQGRDQETVMETGNKQQSRGGKLHPAQLYLDQRGEFSEGAVVVLSSAGGGCRSRRLQGGRRKEGGGRREGGTADISCAVWSGDWWWPVVTPPSPQSSRFPGIDCDPTLLS